MNAKKLIALLADKRLTITTAESCTGGLIAGAITAVSGSSAVFRYGFITYANDAKISLLGVPASLIARYGAVSIECAKAMAAGALRQSHADIAVSATGVAGPLGGTKRKPVGTVCIGIATRTNVYALRSRFTGGRRSVRAKTVRTALARAYEAADAL